MLKRTGIGTAIGSLIALSIGVLGVFRDKLLPPATGDRAIAIIIGMIAAGAAGGIAAAGSSFMVYKEKAVREAEDDDAAAMGPGCIGTLVGVISIWAVMRLLAAIAARADLAWELSTNTPVDNEVWYPFAVSFGLMAACYPALAVVGFLISGPLSRFVRAGLQNNQQMALFGNVIAASLTVMVQWTILFWRNW